MVFAKTQAPGVQWSVNAALALEANVSTQAPDLLAYWKKHPTIMFTQINTTSAIHVRVGARSSMCG